jgi:hypothetical protein
MAYTVELIQHELAVIRERLASEHVLDESAGAVLASMEAQLQAGRSRKKWRFEVNPSQPLRFRQCNTYDCKDVKFDSTVDISGVFPAPIDGTPAREHSIVVRVWTTDPAVWFVERLDAESLQDDVDRARGRVVHRFHFDAASSPNEPWSHLHVGGRTREPNEYFRFPEDQSLPRFLHHPMGLIQTCEFVLYHFFPNVHDTVAKEDSWRHALGESEKAYLGRYWEKLRDFARNGKGAGSYHEFCCVPC